MINVVCAVIRDASGRLLVCQRPAGKALAGKWEFPGGKVETGEEPVDALKREIAEELGCEISVGEQLEAVMHHYPEFSISLTAFLCTMVSGDVHPLEHAEVRWVTLEKCPQLDWAEADIPIWTSLQSK